MTQNKELTKTLETLHLALKNYKSEEALDEKSIQLIEKINQDMKDINDAHTEGNTLQPIALDESIVHFEQSHPTLTGILREIADLLNKSGI
ncbi:MAG: DUF4404 family protein [Gammaproteobacteria bacterium]|nr:DUF4404 family protein [Gammaproteobacteria bacterium]